MARSNGCPITLIELISMKIRKIPAEIIVEAAICLKKAQIDVSTSDLEAHYLAGGHVKEVALGLVAAKKVNINTNFKMLTAIDLCGRDVIQMIDDCCKEPVAFNSDTVSFTSKDGKEHRVSVNVTLLKNINKIIGGKGDQNLINKIFDFIGAKIAECDSNNRASIEPSVLEKEISDAGFSKEFISDIKSIKINM